MGKITVFTLDGCPVCSKTLDILSSKTDQIYQVSLTKSPEYKSLVFLLSKGRLSVPQVFFNQTLIGGGSQVEKLESEGGLDGMVQDCLASSDPPLELRIPPPAELLEVIPKSVREKWTKAMENELGPKLQGSRPITAILVIVDTPGTEMLVGCSVGEGSSTFPAGSSGPKGTESKGDKFYCQVALQKFQTQFFDGPSTYSPDLLQNFDHVKLGWSWYLGAPWKFRDIQGTIAVLEKEPGILKSEQMPIVEAFRDQMVKDLEDCFGDETHWW